MTSYPVFLEYSCTPRLQERTERKKRDDLVKMFDLYWVIEDMEGPDTAGDDGRGLG